MQSCPIPYPSNFDYINMYMIIYMYVFIYIYVCMYINIYVNSKYVSLLFTYSGTSATVLLVHFPKFFLSIHLCLRLQPILPNPCSKTCLPAQKTKLSALHDTSSCRDSETLRKTLWFSAWSTISITTCHSIS